MANPNLLKTSLLLALIVILLPLKGNSQNPPCVLKIDHTMSQEEHRTRISESSKAFNKWKEKKDVSKIVPLQVTIPVHVIIVHNPSEDYGVGGNISEAQIAAQIDVLNVEFARESPDTIQVPDVFPTLSSGIQFCLASLDPEGNQTNGITRFPAHSLWQDEEENIMNQTMWPRDQYLNIYVAEPLET